MKKVIYAFAAIVLQGLISPCITLGQQPAGYASSDALLKTAQAPLNTPNTLQSALPQTAGNAQAITPAVQLQLNGWLTKNFPAATDAQWTAANGQFYYVTFTSAGRKARASFSPRGLLNYAITACSITHLPAKLARKIEKDYPAHKLLSGSEITAYGETVYQILLEGSSNFVKLECADGNINEVQTTVKPQQ